MYLKYEVFYLTIFMLITFLICFGFSILIVGGLYYFAKMPSIKFKQALQNPWIVSFSILISIPTLFGLSSRGLGYLLGQFVITPIFFMLIIGSIYFFIRKILGSSEKPLLTWREAIFTRWVIYSAISLTILGLIGKTVERISQ